MYRVNLYPEHQLKRHQQKKQTIVLGAAVLVVCIQILVIGLQVMNTTLLASQVEKMEADLPTLQQFVQRSTVARPEVGIAQEIVELRTQRTDWAPKLAAISEPSASRLPRRTALQPRQEGHDRHHQG